MRPCKSSAINAAGHGIDLSVSNIASFFENRESNRWDRYLRSYSSRRLRGLSLTVISGPKDWRRLTALAMLCGFLREASFEHSQCYPNRRT